MDCRKAEELLQSWIDGELDESERAALTAHLAECSDCARRLAEYKHLGALLDRIDAQTVVPPGLYGRIMEAVERESAPARGGAHRWTRWAASAAAVLLLGVTAGVLWRSGIWPGPMNKSAVPYKMADEAAPQEAPAADMEAPETLMDGARDTDSAAGESAEEPCAGEEFGIAAEISMKATWNYNGERSADDRQSGIAAIESFCAENDLTVLETGDGWISVQWENDDEKQALLAFLSENGELAFEDSGTDTTILRINIR